MTTNRRAQVAVIGAGPAGAAAAVVLAESGMDTILLDRAHFPRDKVCGDGLLPDAFRPLARLGTLGDLEAVAHAARGIRFRAPSGVEGFVPVAAMVIPRRQLDSLLVERARRAGAEVVEGATLEEFEGPPGAVRAAQFGLSQGGGRLRVEARFFVLATGASPRPRLLAGLGMAPRPGAAVRGYVSGVSRDEGELFIVFQRERLARGYYWAFPVGGGVFNVGCGVFGLQPQDPSLLEEVRHFAAQLSPARSPEGARGAPLQSAYPRLAVVRGNTLAVGEAAGLTRPFSGEGVGPALESGLLAGEALAAAGDEAGRVYARRLAARFAREFAAYRWGERLLGWPWLVDALVRRVEGSVAARRRVKAVLAAQASPVQVLSLRGLTALLLGR